MISPISNVSKPPEFRCSPITKNEVIINFLLCLGTLIIGMNEKLLFKKSSRLTVSNLNNSFIHKTQYDILEKSAGESASLQLDRPHR